MNNWQSMFFSAKGRIRRSQYWLWSLGLSFGWIILLVVMMAIGGDLTDSQADQTPSLMTMLFIIISYPLLMWASINIIIKRWHDRDKSGWMVLIAFIPIVGGIWSLIECGFLDGTQGPNQFGPSPKGIGASETVF